MDRRQPLHTRGHGNLGAIVLIVQNTPVRPGRQREQWMLHRGQIVFGDRPEDIAEEEIPLPFRRNPIRCQLCCHLPARIRSAARRDLLPLFGDSFIVVLITPTLELSTCPRNGVPDSQDRGFGVVLSGFQSHSARKYAPKPQ